MSRRRRVLDVTVDGYRSVLRGPGAREIAIVVSGRAPVWVHLARGYSVSEATAKDAICLAEERGYDIVVTGPRPTPRTPAPPAPGSAVSPPEPEPEPVGLW